MCAMCVPGTQEGQKRALLGLLRLELQAVVNCQCGSSGGAAGAVLLTAEPSITQAQ